MLAEIMIICTVAVLLVAATIKFIHFIVPPIFLITVISFLFTMSPFWSSSLSFSTIFPEISRHLCRRFDLKQTRSRFETQANTKQQLSHTSAVLTTRLWYYTRSVFNLPGHVWPIGRLTFSLVDFVQSCPLFVYYPNTSDLILSVIEHNTGYPDLIK